MFFLPLSVCIYQLSLHENFGQKQKQGYTEKSFGWEILVCWIMLVGSKEQRVNTRKKTLYPTLPFLVVFFSLSNRYGTIDDPPCQVNIHTFLNLCILLLRFSGIPNTSISLLSQVGGTHSSGKNIPTLKCQTLQNSRTAL